MYSPSQTLPLSSAISMTQYRDKALVSQMLTDTFLSSPRSKILLITRINPYSPKQNETIFLVHHIIPVPYGTKTFDVEILIYFPSDFPLRAPKFYFFNLTELFSQKNALTQLKTKLQVSSRPQISSISPQNTLIGMQSLLDKYSIEESKLYDQVDEARRLRDEEQPLCLETVETIVDIKTPKMLKYCAMENSILEFFQTLKKASAKKIGDFGMLARQYRLLSIELFSIQYLQRKQMNEHLFGV